MARCGPQENHWWGGRRDGSELAQVRHSRGRGAGWVECRGGRLVLSGSCGGRCSV